MALIAPPKDYEPLFDETTGSYKDNLPWPKYFRGPKDLYVCRCNQFEFGFHSYYFDVGYKQGYAARYGWKTSELFGIDSNAHEALQPSKSDC